MLWSVEGRKENKMQRASFELLEGVLLTVKRPSCRTQKGTPYGVGVHVDETGIVEEDVIGKRVCKKRCDPFIENREGAECSGQALSCLGVLFFNGEEAC